MKYKVKEAIKYINKRLVKKRYQDVLNHIGDLSSVYWFVKDVVREGKIVEERVNHYQESYAAKYLRDMILLLFLLPTEKANAIIWEN